MDGELKKALNIIRSTEFYKRVAHKLYVCDEEPDTVFFKPKAEYHSSDLRAVVNELNKYELQFYVQDVSCACTETDGGTAWYTLKEV